MIEPDTLIDDRYRVLSRIGSGGMADVYLAEDQLLGRKVAVKLLHHRFAEDQEFVERFRREASSAAGLSHPNVVAIFDRGEWDGTYYIAMEYLPGRSLKAIIRERGALEPPAAVDIVIQILRAARFAHRRGIIHRDIKPHNVILDEEGRAKVTDFGIARAGASDMTLTGSIMGTAQYLSPEQAQGQAVSEASDLYAIGIVLYELLTGSIPFDGETAVSIAMKQVSAPPPVPSALNPNVPAALNAVVLKALAKDPAKRFVDADQFIAALQAASESLSGRAVPAGALGGFVGGPPTTIGTGRPAAGEDPFFGSSTITDEHHVVGPPTGGLLLPEQADEREAGANGDGNGGRGGGRTALWIAVALVLIAALAVALTLALRTKSVPVPQIAGLTKVGAEARLQEAGLQATATPTPNARVPAGRVVGSSPPAGTEVSKGSSVSVEVSSGPGKVGLPDVSELSRAAARSTLKKAGFKTRVDEHSSERVEAGHVISTEPAAGTQVKLGSTVTVLVSSGPARVSVPQLSGESLQEATARLAEVDLGVGRVTRQPTSSASPETVLSQSPSSGTLARGGVVSLVVASARKRLSVPDVVGERPETASTTLKREGFHSKTQIRTVSEESENGIVVSQRPAPGITAKRESTVTLTVGRYEQPAPTTTPTTPAPPTTTPTTPTTTPTTPVEEPTAPVEEPT